MGKAKVEPLIYFTSLTTKKSTELCSYCPLLKCWTKICPMTNYCKIVQLKHTTAAKNQPKIRFYVSATYMSFIMYRLQHGLQLIMRV